MILFILIWFGLALIAAFVVPFVIGVHNLDKRGLKLEKRTRYKRKTYDNGFGKYIVDVKDEEWVTVPKYKKE